MTFYIVILFFAFLIGGFIINIYWLSYKDFDNIKFKPLKWAPLIIIMLIWLGISVYMHNTDKKIQEMKAMDESNRPITHTTVDEKKANEAGYYKKNGKWYFQGDAPTDDEKDDKKDD